MTQEQEEQQAFPSLNIDGMDLIDHIATQAMHAIISNRGTATDSNVTNEEIKHVTSNAYKYAHALMEVRESYSQ